MKHFCVRKLTLLLALAACAVEAQTSATLNAKGTTNTPPVYFEFQLDVPARLNSAMPRLTPPNDLPTVPAARVVQARFVVDTNGVPEMTTWRVVSSPDPRLSTAARNAAAKLRFQPGKLHGQKVRQMVNYPFRFSGV